MLSCWEMLPTFRALLIFYTQVTLIFISPAEVFHFEFQRLFFSYQVYMKTSQTGQTWHVKMNLCSPHHLLDLLNFLSQQMASSSIIHVRNLEVNRDSTPSLKSHSITKSC